MGGTGAVSANPALAGAGNLNAGGAGHSSLSAPSTAVSTTTAQGMGATPQLQQLAESLAQFSSAEILIALMLASAMQKDDDDQQCQGSAAMGFLAGLAIAGGLGQTLQSGLSGTGAPEAGGLAGSGGLGMNLDFSA